MSQYEFDFRTEETGAGTTTPLTVSELTVAIRHCLQESFTRVHVVGEISNLTTASSGHVYFSLKDDHAQLSAVMWRSVAARLRFQLKNGMEVVCTGKIDVYPPRGSYQLVVSRVEPQGVGALQLAFQQLREKLAAEGLFDQQRKRPIPSFPRRVGFVTSLHGAALHDFLETARKRWPAFHLVVIPSAVQGKHAAREVVAGIQIAQKIVPPLDVLVVGRGGGSMEDLWTFNEEEVVRAVAASRIPTVSAVGHEIDFTLCDFAADARALTPTAAAQLVYPDRNELLAHLRGLAHRATVALRRRTELIRHRLAAWSQRSILARPHELHLGRRQLVDDLEQRARRAVRQRLADSRQRLLSLARAAQALSPLSVLGRGYSVTLVDDLTARPLTDVQDVDVGHSITTILARGEIVSRVEATRARSRFELDIAPDDHSGSTPQRERQTD